MRTISIGMKPVKTQQTDVIYFDTSIGLETRAYSASEFRYEKEKRTCVGRTTSFILKLIQT